MLAFLNAPLRGVASALMSVRCGGVSRPAARCRFRDPAPRRPTMLSFSRPTFLAFTCRLAALWKWFRCVDGFSGGGVPHALFADPTRVLLR